MKGKCKLCRKAFQGRTDKLFCSPSCKATYHYKLKNVNLEVTQFVDKILHRNRSILLEILGKKVSKKKFLKTSLDQKNFNYSYITGTHINKQGKTVFHIYDFSYLIFSNQEVLVTRNNNFKDLF